MTSEKSIVMLKRILEDNGRGMAEEDLKWIREKIIEANPGWKSLNDRNQFEFFVLDELNGFVTRIKTHNPANIRQFVDSELRRAAYKEVIETIRREIRAADSKDTICLDGLGKQLKKALTKIKKEDLEYLTIIQKFATIVAIELKQKREGINSERFHIQPNR